MYFLVIEISLDTCSISLLLRQDWGGTVQ